MSYNKKEHLKQSIEALKTVFLVEKENRKPTAQEIEVIKKYKGFGAIKAVLRPLSGKDTWPKSEQGLYSLIEELNQLLRDNTVGEEAYKDSLNSIRSSVLTAFYTPEPIVKAIADTLHKNELYAENILEPSAGIGAFLNAFKGNEPIVAYEKDLVTARILSTLYPDDIVNPTGYETIGSTHIGSFDMIVSNIPFGDVSVFDPDFVQSDNKVKRFSSQSLHNYFFVKSVDNLREGGVLAFITTQAIMNTPSNEQIRQYLMENTNLVTAIRLPNNLFASHAGTEVGTDLILLQKNSQKKQISLEEQAFLKTKTSPSGIATNLYFESTENIIHTSATEGTNLYGKPAMTYFFDGSMDEIAHVLETKLARGLDKYFDKELFHKYQKTSDKPIKIELVEKVTPQLSLYDLFGLSSEERTQIKPTKKGRKNTPTPLKIIPVRPFDTSPRPFKSLLPRFYEEGMLAAQEGNIGHTRLINGQLLFCPMEIDEDQGKKILAYINIRDTYLSLYNYELDYQEADTQGREKLNQAYDAFVEQYGYFTQPSNLDFIGIDKLSAEILSLEQWQEQQVSKADIFYHPVGFSDREESHTDDLFEALSFSLNRFMKVDMDYISQLTGLQVDSIKESLFDKIYWNPFDKEYQMREIYIAGNVVEKANRLEAYLRDNPDDQESRNTYDAMKAAIPETIPFEELDFNFGERWIKGSVYSNFASQLFDTQVTVAYDSSSDDYIVSYQGYSSAIFHQYNVQGESRNYNGIKLLEHALLNTSPNITKTISKDGQEVRVKDANAIQLANSKIDDIRNLFNEWLKNQNDSFKESLTKDYNDRYNCFVRPQYDGAHQTFPDLDLKALNIPDLYKSQKDAIYMLKCNQGGIIDHEVGGGKTLIICIAAYEMKRLGIVNRPLIIGLKANIDAIATTYATAYPSARILYSGNEDFSPNSREQFFYKLKNNSWDAIILTHEQFGKIPQSAEVQKRILQEELDSIEENLKIMHQDRSISVQLLKGLVKRKENLSANLKTLQLKMDFHKENVTDFKTLGIDHIFVDESHMFKNLMFNTRHDRVAGIGNSTGSQRALNMLYAIRTIQERTGRDLGATFLSGTVISNSLTELYSVFKYMRPRALENQNIRSFDAWAAVFAKKTIDYEFSVTNEIIQKERFRYFIKVPELAQFYNEITDYRTAEEIGIDRPEKHTILHNIPQTADQEAFAENLISFAKTGDGTLIGRAPLTDSEMTAKMLIATNTSKKMSLDMRLIDSETYGDDEQNKISVAAKELADRYYRFNSCKGTQFVFCDLGTYKKEGWNVYSELKRKLVEEYRIPSPEIRFIQEATSDKTRNNIIDLMNKGSIRILLGSTQKLGTGVNAQQRAVAVHHLDVTWRPSDLTQRDGRAVRKGNEIAKLYADNKVDILFYAVEKTLDSYMFNLLHNKQLFITQMKRGTTGVRTLDEGSLDESNGMNFSEYVAILSGNPELLEKARLEKKIAALESERVSFQRNKRQYNGKTSSYTEALSNKNRIVNQLENDKQQLNSKIRYDEKNVPLSPIILNDVYPQLKTEKDIGSYLCNLADNLDTDGKEVHIGSLYGFGLFAQTKTVKTEDELFKTNKFFIQNNGGIKYTHLNGVLPHTPELATASFLKALQSIPKLLKSAIVERDKIEKDIEAFNKVINSPFAKDLELAGLKERLNVVERNLQISLSNEVNGVQNEEKVSEPKTVYSKFSDRQFIILNEIKGRRLTSAERNVLAKGQTLFIPNLQTSNKKVFSAYVRIDSIKDEIQFSHCLNPLDISMAHQQVKNRPNNIEYNQGYNFILRNNENGKVYNFSRSNIEIDPVHDEVRIAVPKKYVTLLLEAIHFTHNASVKIDSQQSSLCPDIKLTEITVSPISEFPFLVHKIKEEINQRVDGIKTARIENEQMCVIVCLDESNKEARSVLSEDEFLLYQEGIITPIELAEKHREVLLHYDETIKEQKELTDNLTLNLSEEKATAEDVLLASSKRIMEEGEFFSIERVFRKTGSISFCGQDSIKTAEDVAYVFRCLEDSSIENAYMAYICNDKTVVQHLAIGDFTSTFVPIPSILAAVYKLKPESAYLVHNHPSGNLAASQIDYRMHRAVTQALGGLCVVKEGIIINLNSGKYGLFDSSYYSENKSFNQQTGEVFELPVYSFDKVVFDKKYIPEKLESVRSSYDIAKFISGHRLGERNKVNILVLNTNQQIVANLFTHYTTVDCENANKIAKEAVDATIIYGGTSFILNGRFPFEQEALQKVNKEARKYSNNCIVPLDAVSIDSQSDPLSYISAADEGFLRENSFHNILSVSESNKKHEGNIADQSNLYYDPMEQSKYKMVDESQINWESLKENFGITKEQLEEKGVLNDMLYFKKSDALFKVQYESAAGKKEFDARVAFKEKEGEYTLQFYPVQQAPELEKPYHGYVFSDEDKKNLLESGNLGKVATIEQYGGGMKEVYISIDHLTNEVVHMDSDKVKIKDEILGVQLTEEQKNTIREGQTVYLKGMTANSGKHFNAYLQINADTKNVSFSSPKPELIEDIYSLKEIKGVPINAEQLAMLSKGEKVELSGLTRRDGKTFDAIVSYNPDTKKIEYDFPQNTQSETKTQDLFIPTKLKGVELTFEQQNAIRCGEKPLISGLKSSKGTFFDAYVILNKEAGRLEMEFPVKNELMGVVLTAEQKGKLQTGEAVWIGGLTKKNGETFKAPVLWDAKAGVFTFQTRESLGKDQKTEVSQGVTGSDNEKLAKPVIKRNNEDQNVDKKKGQKI